MKETEIANLVQFGLTKLEAEIYLVLLQNPNSTGYRIAQILNKPVPNTYKALNSLQAKQLILADSSQKTRIYTAVPIAEYLDYKTIEFNTKRHELLQQLEHYKTPTVEGGIYRLENIQDIISRASILIAKAQDILLVDIFPALLPLLRDEIEKVAASGTRVMVKTYEPTKIKNCLVVNNETDSQLVEKFYGEWLNIIADGREYLLSFINLNKERVYEAFWSKNLFLSLMMHNGFSDEFIFTQIRSMIENGTEYKELLEYLKHYDTIKTSSTHAFQDFMKQFS